MIRPAVPLVLTALLGLLACAAPVIPVAPEVRLVCPVGLVEYPADRQARLAREIREAPPEAVWPDIVRDYAALRDGVRKCHEEAR